MAVAETPNETRTAPRTTATETTTEKGASFARGPALVLGTILLAAGLYSLYRQHTFPPFSNFPNGTAPVDGKVFGVFGANGWTGMLTAVAGGLLLFGAAQHLLAKTMSLIVGVGLGAAAVIALISGNVLGMAAANGWTELAWGIAAAILLMNTLAPRRRRRVERVERVADDGAADRRATGLRPRRQRATDRGAREDDVAPARETAPARDAAPAREAAPADQAAPAREADPADEETRVHDREGAPFHPDDQETRVTPDREGTVESGTRERA